MAKSRRITNDRQAENQQGGEPSDSKSSGSSLLAKTTGQRLATLMASAALVYVAYWPHDSVEVQQGSARYLVFWLLINAAIAFVSFDSRRRDFQIDFLAWCLPGWMAISLIAHQQTANLRLGINELGWWLATAAAISVSRRIASQRETALAFLQLIVAISIGVAVYGWHQSLIGIPSMIAEYEADPDTMLQKIGIAAEQGSAMRVVFENRLYDGGPTGTFALANSMAVMLLGGLIVTVAFTIRTWKANTLLRRCMLVLAMTIVGSMLLGARSRAAVLALVVILGWYGIQKITSTVLRQTLRSRTLMIVSIASLLTLFIGTIVVGFVFRNSEWLAQAPASVAIRLNYWRACFGMLGDSPWFGIGPGQFKASYEVYRAAASNEQIADPHQFLLQIATAGGYPALIITLLLVIVLAWKYLTTDADIESQPEQRNVASVNGTSRENDRVPSVWLGAGLGMSIVWLIGAAIALLPMFDAGLMSTAIAVIVAMSLWYGVEIASGSEFATHRVAAYAVGAMAIALLASGGITVPGVSLVAWMLAGIAVPISTSVTSAPSTLASRSANRLRLSIGFTVLVTVIAISWHRYGVAPVDRVNSLQNQFETRWSQGQIEPAVVSLLESAEADTFNVQPWLQLAALDRTMAVAQPERRANWEQQWLDAEQQAIGRAPRDPVVLKQLGDNRLIHFQRFGERDSLIRASQWFAQAIKLSPSHEAYAAQQAAILQSLADPRALEIAMKAEALSQAGGYYERSLAFTPIYVPKHLGTAIAQNPVQRPAAEVLAPLFETRK